MTPDPTPSPAAATSLTRYPVGQRIRVTQFMPRLNDSLDTVVEGTIVRYEQSKTGSWYAHAKDDRLWLDRLVLKKADGEMVFLNLDQYSQVEAI